jgi:hypothetical protein
LIEIFVPLIACPIFDFTVFISLLLKFISPSYRILTNGVWVHINIVILTGERQSECSHSVYNERQSGAYRYGDKATQQWLLLLVCKEDLET